MSVANFDEKPVAGTERPRCYSIRFDNTAGKAPYAIFYKEYFTALSNGKEIHDAAGEYRVDFNPADEDHAALEAITTRMFIKEYEAEKAAIEAARLAVLEPTEEPSI